MAGDLAGLEERKTPAEYRCDLRRIMSGVTEWTNYTEIVNLHEGGVKGFRTATQSSFEVQHSILWLAGDSFPPTDLYFPKNY